MSDTPRISAIIIAYNQEDVIARTLDSLLSQDCLYEICVSDDCSSDNTWGILQEYSSKHPGLFKLRRNEPNIGIFANEEQTWNMPSGDMVYRIAGDDVCPEGYFRAVVDFIYSHSLDFKSDSFAIVGDCLTIYPDGQRKIDSNLLLDKHVRPLKLKLRELLNDRSACFSRSILDKYIPVSKGRSYEVEAAQDFQLEMFCPSFYGIHVPGSVYYAEIGVSFHLDKEEKLQREAVYTCLAEFLDKQEIRLDRCDRNYLKFRTEYLRFGAERSFVSLLKAFGYYLLSIDLSLGTEGLELSRLWNALKRKRSRI
ncbi:MAG: glycosyltransferase family 2 protein [Bacteroidales bacterium]|nr:glycosyltransferase family 2 protein [Bacteroidales bacterium]